MHILIIPSWYPSTPADIAGSFFREQAQALERAGCKVGVIFPQFRSLRRWRTAIRGRYGVTHENDKGVSTLRYHEVAWFPRMPRLHSRQWIARGGKLFDEYVSLYGMPDVIHAHSALYAGCLARKIWLKYQVPYVITEHNSGYARGMIDAYRLKVAAGAFEMAKKVFAVSSAFCQLLEKVVPGDSDRWEVLPNMVRRDFLEHKLISNRNPENGFSFLHVSSLDSNKAVDTILKAFAYSFRDDGAVRLNIGGDGAGRLQLERLAQTLGIANQVQFLGPLSRECVMEQMSASDAFVLSSKYETFGVVLIEAMALGKPVVATRCGGPESIVRKQDGALVSVDDPEGMGKAMKLIRENIRSYEPSEIRSGCEERFSERAVVVRLMREYVKICE